MRLGALCLLGGGLGLHLERRYGTRRIVLLAVTAGVAGNFLDTLVAPVRVFSSHATLAGLLADRACASGLHIPIPTGLKLRGRLAYSAKAKTPKLRQAHGKHTLSVQKGLQVGDSQTRFA